jgi:hypothetical protein
MANNEITLGDNQPLSNDLKPIKVGGEASIINVSSPTPDGSVDGEVEIKGKLKAKDTVIQGNFNATSTESPPQFGFHSRDNKSVRLDLRASANQNSQLRLQNIQGYWDLKREFSTTSLQFTNGTNTPLTLDGANVGIGTTSPDVDLDIRGTNPSIILADNSPSDNKFIAFNIDVPSDDVHTISVDQADALAFGEKLEANDTSLENEWVRITNAGNVGIGTTSPTTTLDVEGTVSYKHTAFSTAGPTDNVDVSDTTVLEVDTSSNNVIIGGFTGGVQGQILYIVKTNTANFIQLEHNEGGGSQDIFLTTGSDERVVGYGGYTLYCNGTSWFSLSNPTGGADAG